MNLQHAGGLYRGTPPKKRREREFHSLAEVEIIVIEEIVRDAFEDFVDGRIS